MRRLHGLVVWHLHEGARRVAKSTPCEVLVVEERASDMPGTALLLGLGDMPDPDAQERDVDDSRVCLECRISLQDIGKTSKRLHIEEKTAQISLYEDVPRGSAADHVRDGFGFIGSDFAVGLGLLCNLGPELTKIEFLLLAFCDVGSDARHGVAKCFDRFWRYLESCFVSELAGSRTRGAHGRLN